MSNIFKRSPVRSTRPVVTSGRYLASSAGVLVLIAGLCLTGCVQIPREHLSAPIDKGELSDHVGFLAQPALGGRKPRSTGSRDARRYIESRFQAYGLTPWGDSKGYAQPFGFGTNIVGVLPGSDEQLGDQIVLLSAHYDHVGTNEDGKVCLGAADNASGVAVLLEIAEKLSLAERAPRRTVCFAAFDCEETFLLGAFAFTCRDDFDESKLAAVINIDLLGRDFFDVVDNSVFVIGTEGYPDLRKSILDAGSQAHLRVLPIGTDLAGPSSDHIVFEPYRIPCVFFSCGYFADYHEPADTPDKLDYSKMQREAETIFRTVQELAGVDHIEPPAPQEGGDREELGAIEAVLGRVSEQWQGAALTRKQRDKVAGLAARAQKLTQLKDYSLKQRRKFIWDVQSLVLAVMESNRHPPKPQDSQTDSPQRRILPILLRKLFMQDRVRLIEGIRKVTRVLLNSKRGPFSAPQEVSFHEHWGPQGEVYFEAGEDGQYQLIAIIMKYEITIDVAAIRLRGISHGALRFQITFRPLRFIGSKSEAVDYVLLQWRSDKGDLEGGYAEILERVTGREGKKDRDDWLQYRLGELGFQDEKQWVLSLLGGPNTRLVPEAMYVVRHGIPEQAGRVIPQIAANSDLPAHVRATAICLMPKIPDKEALVILTRLLDDDAIWNRSSIDPLKTLDPSHPLYDAPGTSALLGVLKQLFEKDRQHPRTLADAAENKLKKLTGQDFGKDAAAWREWIESHFAEAQAAKKP